MTINDSSPSAFNAASLHQAVQQALATATIPAHHGAAILVDPQGVEAVLATRAGKGWEFQAQGGYRWQTGASGSLSVSKSW